LADTQEGFDTAAFTELARHEIGHFWFEPRSRLLTGLAGRFFPAAKRYLEVGCGTGVVLKAMSDSRSWSRLAGSELHPAGLVHARQRLGDRAEFLQMDARRIPAREAFDLIGAFDVLEHIPEDTTVLQEVHTALVPGGGFLLAVPQHPTLWSQADVAARHVRRYRRGELERKLRAARFEILFSTSYASVVLPLMFASRSAAPRAATCELAMHPMLNGILRRTLDAEVSLTLKGLAWPAGGSRVVVARKPFASERQLIDKAHH
jgi:SAM-dependent methyltransferase